MFILLCSSQKSIIIFSLQPGHAAMTRWTPTGWVVCLGAGMEYSWWEDQCGIDFEVETKARRACGSETAFMQQVLRLQWIAAFRGEQQKIVRGEGLPDPNSPWYSLGMMQRRRLVSSGDVDKTQNITPCRNSRLGEWMNKAGQYDQERVSVDSKSGVITIPASTCSNPSKQTQNVLFLPSFLDGAQLYIQQDAVVEYKLPSSVRLEPQKYKLSLLVCTVHRKEQPLLLSIISPNPDDPDFVHSINMPYTIGEWSYTDDVIVDVSPGEFYLRLARRKQPFGFSFKCFRLCPI
jgi:hypothetical protein